MMPSYLLFAVLFEYEIVVLKKGHMELTSGWCEVVCDVEVPIGCVERVRWKAGLDGCGEIGQSCGAGL